MSRTAFQLVSSADLGKLLETSQVHGYTPDTPSDAGSGSDSDIVVGSIALSQCGRRVYVGTMDGHILALNIVHPAPRTL
jgi:hypothetical protein